MDETQHRSIAAREPMQSFTGSARQISLGEEGGPRIFQAQIVSRAELDPAPRRAVS
jgi:hypothetical protein